MANEFHQKKEFNDKKEFSSDTKKKKKRNFENEKQDSNKSDFIDKKEDIKTNHFVNLEKGEKISTGVLDKVTVFRGEGQGGFYINDPTTSKMEKRLAKTKAKAEKTGTKTVHRMEKVYDREKGTYTYKTVTHKVPVSTKAKQKQINRISKGKKVIQKSFNEVVRTAENQLGKDENTKNIDDASKFVIDGAVSISADSQKKSIAAKEKKIQKLETSIEKQEFLIEGRKQFDRDWTSKVANGEVSENSINRSFQKEALKKKYQNEAIKEYHNNKKHRFKALLSSDSVTRQKGWEEIKKKVTSSFGYVIAILLAILIIVLVFGVLLLPLIFSGSSIATLGYLSTPYEVQQTDLFFSEMEMKYIKGLIEFEAAQVEEMTGDPLDYTYMYKDNPHQLIFNYQLPGVKHDSNVLIAYLSTVYSKDEGFKFDEYDYSDPMIADMMDIFHEMYGVTPKWKAVSLGKDQLIDYDYKDFYVLVGTPTSHTTNDNGTYTYKYFFPVGDYKKYKTMEEVIAKKLSSLSEGDQQYFAALMQTKGLQQLNGCDRIFGPDSDLIWQEQKLVQYYGHSITGITDNYTEPGWNPNNRIDPTEESHSTYVQFEADRNISFYSADVGIVESVEYVEITHPDGSPSNYGYEVKIKYSALNGKGNNWLTISGITKNSSITKGATIQKDQVIGTVSAGQHVRLSAETDSVKSTLDNNYVNPFFAIY